jgi:hypothetical protein
MNFASNTAPVASTRPSNVAAIYRSTGCRVRRCTSARALLKWSAQELAQHSSLGVNTIRRAELQIT